VSGYDVDDASDVLTVKERDEILVHVISAKHFTSGYQSEILQAVSIPSKL